jgi:hypothetical protein
MNGKVRRWYALGQRTAREAIELFIGYEANAEVITSGFDGGDGSVTTVEVDFQDGAGIDIQTLIKPDGTKQLRIEAKGDWEAELIGRTLGFVCEVLTRHGFVYDWDAEVKPHPLARFASGEEVK